MKTILELLLYLAVLSFPCHAIQWGKIENVSLILLNQDPIVMNGTCEECQCYMDFNQSFSSFNCDRINKICEMHLTRTQYQLFQVLSSPSSTFHFRSLPQCPPAANCTSLSATAHNAMMSELLDLSEINRYFDRFD